MNKIMELLKKTTLKTSIPPLLLTYFLYKRYCSLKNPPLQHTKPEDYSKSKINYDYDIVKLTNGICHHRSNIINGTTTISEVNDIYVFIHGNDGSLYDFNNIIKELYYHNSLLKEECKTNTSKHFKPKHYIVYDLYGRGYSQYDNSPQTLQLFISQLSELLYALNVRHKVHLVGYEMGSAIATGFASIYPEKIKSLILLSPIGYKSYRDIIRPWWYKYISGNEILMTLLSVYNNKIYTKDIEDYDKEWNDTDSPLFKDYFNNREKYYSNLEYNMDIKMNTISNWKSYVNNFPIGEMEDIYKNINHTIDNIFVVLPECDEYNPVNKACIIINMLNKCDNMVLKERKASFHIEHGHDTFNIINEWVSNCDNCDNCDNY
jgi:pimeloyl-ACP methyl ester carboxylesterase